MGAAVIVTPNGRVLTRTFDLNDCGAQDINVLETMTFYKALGEDIFHYKNVDYYGDNTAMLHTIKATYSKSFALNVAVGRCIAKLQQRKCAINLYYIPSKLNPADGLSRGKQFTSDDKRLLRSLHNNAKSLLQGVGVMAVSASLTG